MSLRKYARTLVTALVLAGSVVAVSPASAKVSDGYVRGYDTYVGDWSDEGVISAGEFPVSNATCLWQHILVAESVANSG